MIRKYSSDKPMPSSDSGGWLWPAGRSIVVTLIVFGLFSCVVKPSGLATAPFRDYFSTQRAELSERDFLSRVESILTVGQAEESRVTQLSSFFSANSMKDRMPVLVTPKGVIVAFYDRSKVGSSLVTNDTMNDKSWKQAISQKKTTIGEFVLGFGNETWLCNLAFFYIEGSNLYLVGIDPIEQRK